MRGNCYRNKRHLLEPEYRDLAEPGSGMGRGPQKHLGLCFSLRPSALLSSLLFPSPFSFPLPAASPSPPPPLPRFSPSSLSSPSPPLPFSSSASSSLSIYSYMKLIQSLEKRLNLRAHFTFLGEQMWLVTVQSCGQCCNNQLWPGGRIRGYGFDFWRWSLCTM